jgi:hypothetical protein
VFAAFREVNKYFYSWKNILRRWFRFIRKQNARSGILRRILQAPILSVIFFRLSIFQRDHAQKKVYPEARSSQSRWSFHVGHDLNR